MDLFAPDLSQYWLNPAPDEDAVQERVDTQRAAQEAALMELRERVQAARSVV